MKVDLIDHMGSDLTVVNAARVSFDKESKWECCNGKPADLRCEGQGYVCRGLHLSERDQKLINYLAEHKHWSPFAHPQVQFRVKAPIFVARQLQKHQVGFAWNEVSRRYVDSEPEFYEPDTWRKRANNVKQGSSDEAVPKASIEPPLILQSHALEVYHQYLEAGVCPEQARMVLPQSMYTEWYWTGSLYAFARMCQQRMDPHTQKETQYIATMIWGHLGKLFPRSTVALCSAT